MIDGWTFNREHIFFFPGRKKARYPYCHSILIEGETKGVVDPCCDRSLARSFSELGVEMVFNTHFHEDHTRYNHIFTHGRIAIHEKDAPCLSSLETLLVTVGVAGTPLEEGARRLHMEILPHVPVENPLAFEDGATFDLGGVKVTAIATPGHTRGHSCFYIEPEEALYLGDIDLTPFGPWYGEKESDLEEFMASLKRIREIPARLWISSHGKGIYEEDIERELSAFESVIEARDERILASLGEHPKGFDELLDEKMVYHFISDYRDWHRFMDGEFLKKHLQRLLKMGIVGVENGLFFVK